MRDRLVQAKIKPGAALTSAPGWGFVMSATVPVGADENDADRGVTHLSVVGSERERQEQELDRRRGSRAFTLSPEDVADLFAPAPPTWQEQMAEIVPEQWAEIQRSAAQYENDLLAELTEYNRRARDASERVAIADRPDLLLDGVIYPIPAHHADEGTDERQRLVEALYDRYRREGEYVHPVTRRPRGIPRGIENAFWDAMRAGHGQDFLDDLDAQDLHAAAEAGGSDKVPSSSEAGGSDNLVTPEGLVPSPQGDGHDHVVVHDDLQPEAAQQRAGSSRNIRSKTIKRSKPRASPRQVLHQSIKQPDLVVRIYSYFTKIGHPIITEHFEQTGERMIVDDLADVLFDKIMFSDFSKHISADGDYGRGVVTSTDVYRKAREAALMLLADWSATYRAEARQRGARGGRKSKRPKVYTVEMLKQAHLDHAGAEMTKQQEADALGCSVPTIKRLRRELAQQGQIEN